MSVPAAYLTVILIWSTTPLAIKWSASGAGFSYALVSRMAIGIALCVLLMMVLRIRLPMGGVAWRAYVAGGFGLAGTMLLVYWSAAYVDSGVISILFGMTPILTGIFAHLWLDERSFTRQRLSGMMLGIGGLVVIFGDVALGGHAFLGMLGVLAGVTIQSLSAVVVKRTAVHLHPLAMNTGSLAVSLVPFILVWLLVDGAAVPEQVPMAASWAILYLGVFGSFIGFNLYFYILQRLPTGVIALITLITPVVALAIGHLANAEAISGRTWIGIGAILLGLGVYQWGGRLRRPVAVAA